MKKEELLEQVNKLDWMHTIDLGNDVVTPGKWSVNQYVMKAFDSIDFKGKKVLDIGACDGLWSFEAEKRGATEVHSVDYLTHVEYWCTPAYNLAHEALGSNAVYNPDLNVYDIETLNIRDFDVVIFCGVYYHLKHPLLAFSKLRRIIKTGGKLIIEGPVYSDEEISFATFHYRKLLDEDRSNWWCPSKQCLREWIQCSYFDVQQELEDPIPAASRVKKTVRFLLGEKTEYSQRTVMVAEAVEHNDSLYSTPDDDLLDFEHNQT